ncbi:MAG: DNA-directed RNA polymerase subunit alpha [Candidatus Hydrogenedentota bacterium]
MIAQEFVKPNWVKIEDGATDTYSRFQIEPFERGYGTTIGNALRRVLLASLEGSAVTALRIEGVKHEFSAIPGVKEDVTDVVLNLKRCDLHLKTEEPTIFTFKHSGAGEVYAGEVFKDADVEVYNPDLLVCTCTSDSTELEMDIKVSHGRGYVTADNFELEHAAIGTVYLDANFSPVKRVNFLVEDARVGQQTDYDRLVLDVWTNGSIKPEAAVREAGQLLIDHFSIFVQQQGEGGEAGGWDSSDPELNRKLNQPVEDLELSVRSANCLKAENIETVRDLVWRSESEMLKLHNFGKRSLDEIKSKLEPMGLSFSMNVGGAEAPEEPETEQRGEADGGAEAYPPGEDEAVEEAEEESTGDEELSELEDER